MICIDYLCLQTFWYARNEEDTHAVSYSLSQTTLGKNFFSRCQLSVYVKNKLIAILQLSVLPTSRAKELRKSFRSLRAALEKVEKLNPIQRLK
jgi:hypothetical protein